MKFKKDLKVASVIISIAFLCNTTLYSYPVLRVPVGQSDTYRRIGEEQKDYLIGKASSIILEKYKNRESFLGYYFNAFIIFQKYFPVYKEIDFRALIVKKLREFPSITLGNEQIILPLISEIERLFESDFELTNKYPVPVAVDWIVTKDCGLNCPICLNSALRGKELSTEEAKSLINFLYEGGCRSLTLTGGGIRLKDLICWNLLAMLKRKKA